MPGPAVTPWDRALAHAARFNEAVVSGGWAAFAKRFAPDATLRFPQLPLPPVHGRDAVRVAYEARPPDETLRVLDAVTDPDKPGVDVVKFAWASGATGTMHIRWSGELVADLAVTFDRPAADEDELGAAAGSANVDPRARRVRHHPGL